MIFINSRSEKMKLSLIFLIDQEFKPIFFFKEIVK